MTEKGQIKMPITIKLSDEKAAKLGIKTAEDAEALLDKSKETEARATKAETENKTLSERVDVFETRLKAVEDRKSDVNIDDVAVKILPKAEAAAKAEASREAMAVIAKVGGAALTNKEKPADVTDEKTAEQKAKESGDHKAQWKASPKLQEEFSSAESYEAYMKAVDRGQVQISAKG